MQVSIETITGLERKLTVAVPAEELNAKVNEKLAALAQTANIKGFRKGKAPMKIIHNQYGDAARQEVAGDLINSSYLKALEQEEVNPAGSPRIEVNTLEAGKDLEYVATLEVYPEVNLSDFSSFDIKRCSAELTEADIDKAIDSLREQKASFKEVERAAANGDKVIVDYVGTKDGEEFKGGKASDSEISLGSNSMIPGFEDGIVGMKPGDQKTLSLTFPDDYQAENLKGADVEFAVTVKKIQEKILPEIDDAFLKSFGSDSLEAFRQDIKINMERELKRALRAKLKKEVMDKLLQAHEVELPRALVASEIESLREKMMHQFGSMTQNKDLNVKELLPDDIFREESEKRVSLGLIVGQVVGNEGIKPDADRIKEYIAETASSYENPQEVINYYHQNQQMLAGIQSIVLEDMVVDLIIDAAKITDEVVTYEEAIKTDQ